MESKPHLDPSLVERLRSSVVRGKTLSSAMEVLFHELPNDKRSTVWLVNLVCKAFCLSIAEASQVAAWEGPGIGVATNERLDQFVMPSILRRQPEWES
ncbi:hypothetical protein AB1L30_01780 [Bremerella sp. JC817]|uniref:hypothetical protein n=1 Tax=Bremerella sp. JC817 TaxID=3231756 RepID=UPI00345795AC